MKLYLILFTAVLSYYEKFADGIEKCIDNEVPFNLPAGWSFERLRSIFIINPKNTIPDDTDVSFIPMTLLADKYSGKYEYKIKEWKTCKKGFTHFAEGDIAFAKISPCFENRKSAYFNTLVNGFGAGTTELYVLRFYTEDIDPLYLFHQYQCKNKL